MDERTQQACAFTCGLHPDCAAPNLIPILSPQSSSFLRALIPAVRGRVGVGGTEKGTRSIGCQASERILIETMRNGCSTHEVDPLLQIPDFLFATRRQFYCGNQPVSVK